MITKAPITETYSLPLHDALPIFAERSESGARELAAGMELARRRALQLAEADAAAVTEMLARRADRKSTRLNSSHVAISYAVFRLKKTRPADETAPDSAPGDSDHI